MCLITFRNYYVLGNLGEYEPPPPTIGNQGSPPNCEIVCHHEKWRPFERYEWILEGLFNFLKKEIGNLWMIRRHYHPIWIEMLSLNIPSRLIDNSSLIKDNVMLCQENLICFSFLLEFALIAFKNVKCHLSDIDMLILMWKNKQNIPMLPSFTSLTPAPHPEPHPPNQSLAGWRQNPLPSKLFYWKGSPSYKLFNWKDSGGNE